MYRRCKSMFRNLVKTAKTKKHQAKIHQGSICIDGKTYSPNQFSRLPEGIRPHDTCTIQTVNDGFAFSSEWSMLSNMAPCHFFHQDILINSAEQCFQY